jgi:hypothetical protein
MRNSTKSNNWIPSPMGFVLTILMATLCLAPIAHAANDAGIAGAFLRYGSSARSLGLGGAVSALSGDASTVYWNPAGLSQLRTMEVTAMGATLFEDTKYSFLSFGMPNVGKGAIAFSGTFVGSDGFERATLWDDLDSSFSESEGVFSLSYAGGGSRLGYGVTFKSVSQDIAGVSGTGVGADVGVYMRPDKRLALGLSLQNAMQPKILLNEQEEKLAKTIRGGLGVHLFQNRLLVLADLLKTDYMDVDFQGGLEMWMTDNLVMRGGYDTVREQISYGAGVRYEGWQVDFTHIDHDLGSASVLSATMRFGISRGVKISRDKAMFSPSGNNRNVLLDINTAVHGDIDSWYVEVLNNEGKLVRKMMGNGAPPATLSWGGEDETGRMVTDGAYIANVVITDDLGQQWNHEVAVEILGFRNRTRTPIRVDISGTGTTDSGEVDR